MPTIATTPQETPHPRQEQVPPDDRWAEKTMPPSPAERSPAPAGPVEPPKMPEPARAATDDHVPGAADQPPQATPRAESTPQTASPNSDLLGNPQIPISGDAAASLTQIDSHARRCDLLVSTQAKAKRNLVKLFINGHRQLITATIGSHILALSVLIGQQQARAVSWLVDRAATVQGFVLGLITRAATIGTAIGARIRGGLTGLTAGVTTGVNSVITRVLDTARSIPIPNIPGLGRVRSSVLRAADRIGGVVRRALANVQHFINRVIGAVIAAILGVIGRVGAALAGIVARLIAVVARVVLLLIRTMRSLKQFLTARLHRFAARVKTVLARIESIVVARIDQAEARAHAAIAANRRHGRTIIFQILAFSYTQDDYPAEEAVNGPLERVDTTSSKEEFERSARAALHIAVARMMLRNFEIVDRFREDTDSLINLAKGAIVDFLNAARQRVLQAVREAAGHVAGALGRLINHGAMVATRIMDGLRAVIERLRAVFDRVVMVVTEVVRVPLAALANIARTLIGAVRGFLQRIISRLVSLLRSITGGGTPEPDSSSLTGGFAAFDPARLAAAARMASPPHAILLVLVGGGIVISEATVALILTILMWVAIVLIILLLLYALVMAIRWYLARPRAIPRTRPITRPRPRPRRRRSSRGLLRWNPSMVYGAVVASGGMPGTLDTTGRLPTHAPLHGHHVWPQFVGGPTVQPLMSIRGTVHISIVHPSLNRLLQGTARAMGHTISTHTRDPRNIAFVDHLRRDLRRRAIFSGAVTGYYTGLNAVTRPAIPAAAYLRGIVHSFPRI